MFHVFSLSCCHYVFRFLSFVEYPMNSYGKMNYVGRLTRIEQSVSDTSDYRDFSHFHYLLRTTQSLGVSTKEATQKDSACYQSFQSTYQSLKITFGGCWSKMTTWWLQQKLVHDWFSNLTWPLLTSNLIIALKKQRLKQNRISSTYLYIFFK